MRPGGGRILLAASASALSLGLPFFRLSANRMLRGEPLYLAVLSPLVAGAILLVWGVYAWAGDEARRSRSFASAAATTAAALLPLAAAALAAGSPAGAAAGLGDPSSIARLSPGLGFWTAVMAAFIAFLLPRSATSGAAGPEASGAASAVRGVAAAVVALGAGALFATGALDSLSIVKEYGTQREVFAGQLLRHIELSGAALAAGGIIGAAAGGRAARSKAFRSGLFFFLNLVQTIPSLALFGFLIIPLSALAARFPALRAAGIGGIGPAPALIALSLYAALPVARNCLTALELVPAAALDAGRGMGMGRTQLFLRVELPLSLPLAVAGLRVAAVQAIGNTAIAALIGAGGLGVFIFQGLGQYAMDMVLLGTLPVIALSLAVDALMGLVGRAVEPRRSSAPSAVSAASAGSR